MSHPTSLVRMLAGSLALLLLCATTAFAQTPLITDDGAGALRTDWSGTVGLQFTVGASNITVTELGFWDNSLNGNTIAHSVGIWSNTGTLLGSVSVNSGTTSPLTGEFRYKALTSAITLTAGVTYRLGAQVTNGNADSFHDQSSTAGVTYSPGVTVNNGAYSANGTGFVFPNTAAWGAGRAYVGPNMKFTSGGGGPDTTPPAVALGAAPAAGATVSGSAVALTATASDNVGVVGVQFKLNNTINIGTEDTVAPYSKNWDTIALENGVYQLTAVARDAAGNTTTSAPVSVFVKNLSTAGAVVQWTTYEAEDAVRSAGTTLKTATTWGASGNEPAFEARGKQSVVLNSTGQYVEWTNVVAANRVTVRYSMPAETSTGTLLLKINGGTPINLPLTGAKTREGNRHSIPGGVVRYWDDVMVAATVPNNATIRLEHNTGTVAYDIDFLELETAPAALPKPAGTWVTVAAPTGDDRQKIVDAIATADGNGNKKVWFPAGTYTVSSGNIIVPAGIEMHGAGIWHTTIRKNFGGSNARMFRIEGAGNTVRHMKAVDTTASKHPRPRGCARSSILLPPTTSCTRRTPISDARQQAAGSN